MDIIGITQHVASAVSEAIDAAGETQLSVSEGAGIPRTTLIRRLRGQSPFTVAELERIASHLNVSVTSLIAQGDAA